MWFGYTFGEDNNTFKAIADDTAFSNGCVVGVYYSGFTLITAPLHVTAARHPSLMETGGSGGRPARWTMSDDLKLRPVATATAEKARNDVLN